jgi:hypothetical protein
VNRNRVAADIRFAPADLGRVAGISQGAVGSEGGTKLIKVTWERLGQGLALDLADPCEDSRETRPLLATTSCEPINLREAQQKSSSSCGTTPSP